MEPDNHEEPKDCHIISSDGIPKWLEDMTELYDVSSVSGDVSPHPLIGGRGFGTPPGMDTDIPHRILNEHTKELGTWTKQDGDEVKLIEREEGDGVIKIKASPQEVRHGRRASQGATEPSPQHRILVGTSMVTPGALLSRSADYAQKRNSSSTNLAGRHADSCQHSSRSAIRESEQQLEESWSNLSFFNQTQRGRLSARPTESQNHIKTHIAEKQTPHGSLDSTSVVKQTEGLGDDGATIKPNREQEKNELLFHGFGANALIEGSKRKSERWGNSLGSIGMGTKKEMKLGDSVNSDQTGSGGSSLSSDPDVEDFPIPELPEGRVLELSVVSTWGDPHYVGLNGIEMFTDTGAPAPVLQITADPADINTLPGYSGDPRVAANLIDGVNLTRDDMHMWLAPFTEGRKHVVKIVFSRKIRLALIRIWNYNKSRVHSYRGARFVEITLDGVPIFQGEIARACGGDKGAPRAFGDTILFTTDEAILESVSLHDKCFALLCSENTLLEPYYEAPSDETYDRTKGGERPFTKARGFPLPIHKANVDRDTDPQIDKQINEIVLDMGHWET